MAILGYSTKGTSTNSGVSTGRCYMSKFTLASAQTLQELHGWFSAGAGSTVRIVIYADSSGLPGARVAYTASLALTGVDANLSETGFSVSLPAGDYWIGFYVISQAGGGWCWCEDTGGTHQGIPSGVANPPPDPFGTPTTSGTRKHSCWAVVGAAAGPAFVPQIVIT